MTTQSPDQSLTQPPAPSKEMEERCDHDERDHGICLHCGKQTDMNAHDYVSEESSPAPKFEESIKQIACSMKWSDEADYYNCLAALTALAAELGKEREAERSGGRVNSSAFWCDNRHVVDYEEAFNIERDLLAQNAQLKRELAEAREFLAGAQRDANEWNRRWEDNQTKLVNLSAAYQRQKEALERCKRSAEREIAICEGLGHASAYWPDLLATINAALAETPDVSLLEENATLKRRLDEAMNVANRLATVAKHHRARGQKVGKKAIQSYNNLLKANPEYSPHERFRNRATPAA